MSISRRLSILALSGLCLSAAAIVSPVAAQDVATPTPTVTVTPVVVVPVTPEIAMTNTPAVGVATTYIVQSGDDLYRIGLKFGLSYTVLVEANGIINPNLIVVGQQLTIPAGGIAVATPIPVTSTAMPAIAASATATLPPTTTGVPLPVLGNPDTPATYTVQKGDLLFQIAAQFHTSVSILATLNNLGNGNLIYTGEVLKLPTSGVTASSAAEAVASSTAVDTIPTVAPTETAAAPVAITSTDANILTTSTETPTVAATQPVG